MSNGSEKTKYILHFTGVRSEVRDGTQVDARRFFWLPELRTESQYRRKQHHLSSSSSRFRSSASPCSSCPLWSVSSWTDSTSTFLPSSSTLGTGSTTCLLDPPGTGIEVRLRAKGGSNSARTKPTNKLVLSLLASHDG